VPKGILDPARSVGANVDHSVLTPNEKEGNQIEPALPETVDRVREIWDKLASLGLTAGMEFPEIGQFTRLTQSGVTLMGFASDGTIYFNSDIVGKSGEFDMCVVEEIGHYVTGATDFSRDFQNWLVAVAAKSLERL